MDVTEVYSKNHQSIALISGKTIDIQSPVPDKTDTIQLFSDNVIAAALSDNRQLLAVVFEGSLVQQLYLWRFIPDSRQWSNGRNIANVGSPISLQWQEADVSGYPPIALILEEEHAVTKVFPIENLSSDDAPHHQRSKARRS